MRLGVGATLGSRRRGGERGGVRRRKARPFTELTSFEKSLATERDGILTEALVFHDIEQIENKRWRPWGGRLSKMRPVMPARGMSPC